MYPETDNQGQLIDVDRGMLQLSEEDILARMRLDNPWWQPGRSRLTDGYARRDYFPALNQLVRQEFPRRAVVVMGPRRIGKTVLLQQVIGDLISSGIAPRQVLYVSIDTPVFNRLSLEQLVSIYRRGLAPEDNSRIFVFFDEVQYLRDWETHLKSLVDSYHGIKFTVSGSAAAALRLKSNESGAGRFTDFVLPPLTFAEFLRLTGMEDQLIQKKAHSYESPNLNELNKEFVRYLNFGGFPELALTASAQIDSERFVRSDIIDKVLLRDLPSLYGVSDVQELYSLFATLALNTGNELGLEQLSQRSNVAKNTLKRYLDYLEAAFLIRRVERVDKTAARFQKSMTFKVYLTNPSLRSALFGRLDDDDPRFGFVAETAVFAQWMHSPHFERRIKYGRWDNREVDLIYLNETQSKPVWAVEVKWSDRHVDHSEELQGLIDFTKSNVGNFEPIATTRTASGPLHAKGVKIKLRPTSLYCYEVGKNIVANLDNFKG